MADIFKILEKYRECKIAIYGLGTETQKLLEQIDGHYHIVGLLDSYRAEGAMFGHEIISFTEAVRRETDLILVVARPGSCKAIAQKIKAACVENKIDLLDIRGNDLCEERRNVYDFSNVSGITREQLTVLIERHEIVSIDLFDTLIMRNVLFVTDLFELLDARLRASGVEISDFPGKRLSCEKELSGSGAPTLREIYSKIVEENSVQGIGADELTELEWRVDYDTLVPRKALCDYIAEIYRAGKNVYIVSDTYYSRCQIEKMLKKCGIDFYTDLLLSCEYGNGKRQGLFEHLKAKSGGKSCIHIGDDILADIESAAEHGLETCRIYSGIDLFEAVGYFGIWDDIKCLSDRLKMGMFLAKLFNDPFQFETQDRKVRINSAYDIGYLIAAPMIADFTVWFQEQVQKWNIKNIWFCSRDGYLIQKLYEELDKDSTSIYFLTSRTVAIRAGIRDEKDIRYVQDMNFSGSVQAQLKERFGIQIDENDASDGHRTELLDYTTEILEKTAVDKRNYRQYIKRLQVNDAQVAFFDFVAKGTCQMFVGHVVPNHLKGLYFLQLEKENMEDKGLDIVSFYDTDTMKNSTIYDDYYILETILTSDMPQIASFDANGEAVYSEDVRSADDIKCVREMQTGIYDYFKKYISLHADCELKVNREMDEKFWNLIHRLNIYEKRFIRMKVEDRFVNRFTDLNSLI